MEDENGSKLVWFISGWFCLSLVGPVYLWDVLFISGLVLFLGDSVYLWLVLFFFGWSCFSMVGPVYLWFGPVYLG